MVRLISHSSLLKVDLRLKVLGSPAKGDDIRHLVPQYPSWQAEGGTLFSEIVRVLNESGPTILEVNDGILLILLGIGVLGFSSDIMSKIRIIVAKHI